VPIGGSSAGMASLGAIVFSALDGSVSSEDALANPAMQDITLSPALRFVFFFFFFFSLFFFFFFFFFFCEIGQVWGKMQGQFLHTMP
jgi:hypothetical protein